LIDSKGRNFGGFGLAYAEMAALKRKAGASSRTPYAVIYEVKYTWNYRNVKRKLLLGKKRAGASIPLSRLIGR
jgi:hypothetical protein